jgi:hypothetical protein
VAILILFSCLLLQGPISLQQQQKEAIAQQQPEQETRQRIPLGAAADSNFTNYTNPQYGFSLLSILLVGLTKKSPQALT